MHAKKIINPILNVKHPSLGLELKCWAKQMSSVSPTLLKFSHVTPKIFSPSQLNDSSAPGNMISRLYFKCFC